MSDALDQQLSALRQGSRRLARLSAEARTQAIHAVADALEARQDDILAANRRDLEANPDLDAALRDRLVLNPERLNKLVAATRAIAQQPDPVGAVAQERRVDSGLLVRKVRAPLGVVMMIFESRPNVTIDAAALCLRSGNGALLRGGREAWHSNGALFAAIQAGLEKSDVPKEAVLWVEDQDRKVVSALLQRPDAIDLVIPRGGTGLIRAVTEQSQIPVIQHYQGICHVYVDGEAQLEMGSAIAYNAKVQRPGVCNAIETLLVHQDVAADLLADLGPKLVEAGVELFADEAAQKHLPSAQLATDEHFATEFLSLKLAIKTVANVDEAIAHIDRFGSFHTASIVTQNGQVAERFLREVDASCVLHNASTRFNDGGELGLGAEMGISTTKLHAYGPMGADELTTQKFVVLGEGQIRG